MTRRVALALLVLWFMQAMLWPASPASSPTTAVAIGTQDAETGGMQYANWYFGQDNLTSVSVAIQINRDPLTDDGLYFQSYNGYINGHQFYFGLQTRVGKPGYALTGKGLILSEFGTVDSSNMRVAPGGWYEVGSGEGLFISTRFGYAWKAGNYVLAIKYQETDATGDWYAFWIMDTSANVQTYAGALRFATPSSQSKKGIGDGGGSWTELYYREVQDSVLPEWSISIVEVSAVSRDGNTLHPNTAYLRNADNFYHIDQVFHSDSNHLDFLIGGSSTKSFTAKSVTLTPYPAPSIPDTTPPTITVAPGIDGSVVSAATLRLTGKATDNVGVGQVYVGFNKVDMGADGSFASTV
ncbi:MAG: hypothetical protein NTV26_07095, partial [Caldiserica bacterium]|nr:hypothetical protein [Caldisericota bacterium]